MIQEEAIEVIVARLVQMGVEPERAEMQVRMAIGNLAEKTPQVRHEMREYAYRAFLK